MVDPYQQMHFWDYVYDLFGIFLGLSDVLTDYLITYQFFDRGHYVFGWISISFLILMHLYSSYLYVLIFTDQNRISIVLIIYIMTLPFACVLPFIIWIGALGLWDKYCHCHVRIFKQTGEFDGQHDHTAEWIKIKVYSYCSHNLH